MSERDFIYYQQREQRERERAERAADQTARRAHLDMADRYAERMRTMVRPEMPQPA